MPNQTDSANPAWQPAATLEALKFRGKMLARVRGFFDQRGFFEVQTPCLLDEAVVDAHLEPIVVAAGGSNRNLFLQTSPEAAMKRLMAAGAEAIYQLGPVFRADETGQYHNLEFTMLEWYRRGDGMEAGIDLLVDLVKDAIPNLNLRRTSYRQLFEERLQLDPLSVGLEALENAVQRYEPSWQLGSHDPAASVTERRDDLLDVLMGFVVQPSLDGGVIVTNYPLSQAALARRSDDDAETAERFELFINGVEIANGYAELCDPDELQRRTDENNLRRRHRGAIPLSAPTRLLAAMRNGFPECSGTALGFDRLVMAAGNFQEISQVLAFPGCK